MLTLLLDSKRYYKELSMEKNKKHILVVDDDNRIRDLLKEYLNENKLEFLPYYY